MMEEDRFDELLRQTMLEVEPPPAPREEMWSRIQVQRAQRAAAPHVIPFRRRLTPPVMWSAALAATLVIGFGIGRFTQVTPVAAPVATSTAPSTDEAVTDAADAVPAAYRFAATQHLQRTEALLTSLSVDAGTTTVAETSSWARELLTDTRLMLASPAAQDPALRTLLEDLELVLAQISNIPTARAKEEVGLIQDGINQSDVLLRVRAATAGRRPAGT